LLAKEILELCFRKWWC